MRKMIASTSKMHCPTNKKFYRTRNVGWKASLYFYQKLGNRSTPYKCHLCSDFHLTTQYLSEPPKKFREVFEQRRLQLLEKEWKMLRRILNIKTGKEKKREMKRFYKQTYTPISKFRFFWLKIRNRYFRWFRV